MAKIDEMVLSMDFDNSRFKAGASETLSVLDRLKKNLNFDSIRNVFKGTTREVSDLQKSVKSVDLNSIGSQLSTLTNQWSVWGTVSRTVIGRVTNSVINLGQKIKGVVWDPIVTGGMNRAQNLEQANFMLRGTLGDTADAAEEVKLIMENANTAVVGTAFGLDEAAKTAAQFAASGMRGGDEMMKALRGISGAAAMTNSSYDEMSNIFTTVNGNGRLMTEQLNQMASRGLNAAATLAKHFNVTEGELREMVTEGKVQFKDFYTAMDNAYGEHATKATETYSGALAGVRSALGRIGAKVATPYLEDMRDVFNALARAIDGVSKLLDPFINLIVDHMGRASRFAVGHIKTFTAAIQGFTDPELANPSAGWMKFFNFLQDLMKVAGLVGEVVVDAFKVMGGAAPTFIEMSDTVTSTGTKIQHIFRKVLSVFMLVPEIIGLIIKEFLGLSDGAESVSLSFLDIVDGIASFLYLVAEAIRESKLLQVVVRTVGTVARIAVEAFALLGRGIAFVVDIAGRLLGRFKPITDRIVDMARAVADFWLNILDFEFPSFDEVAESFGNLWDKVKNFKLPKLNLREFTTLGNVVESITGWFGRLVENVRNLDFSWFTEFFSGFGNIGQWLSDFEMPEINMSSLYGARDRVSDLFSNMKTSGNLDFAFKIRDVGVKAADFIKGIDYAGIYEGVKNGLVNAFQMAAEGLNNFSKWVGDAIGNVDWSSLGTTIGEGFVKAFTFVTGSAAAIVGFLNDFFRNIFEQIDWEGMLEGLKNFKDTIGGAFSEIGQAFRGETFDIDTSSLQAAVGGATAQVTVDVVQELGVRTKSIREVVGDFFGALFGTKSDIKPEDSELLKGAETFGGQVRTIGTKLKDPFNEAKTAITTEATSLGTTIKTNVQSALENIDLVGILNAIGLAFTGGALFKLSESIEKIAAVPEALSGALKAMGDSFKSIGEAAKTEAKGNYILKLAAALGILAASVWFLSQLSWGEMAVGVTTVGLLLAGLIGSMVVMDKVIDDKGAEKLSKLGTSMLIIAAAVGILSASVWFLAQMDFLSLLQGLGAVILLLAGMAGAAALAGSAAGIAGVGLAFLGIGAGLMLISQALIILKLVNWPELLKGLAIMAGLLVAIGFAARIADGKELLKVGGAMIGMGVGLLALSYGLAAIAGLDEEQLLKGMLVLGGVMLGLTLMSRYGGKDMAMTMGTLIGVAGAIIILAMALKVMEGVDLWRAVGSLIVLIGGLAALGGAMRAFPKDMPKIAGSIMGIALALGILVAAIWIIGNMDFWTVAQGVAVLGGALAGLFFIVKKLPPDALGKLIGLSVGLLALSGALLVIAFAMKVMEDISWESFGMMAATLGVLFVAMLAFGLTGKFIGVGLAAIGAGLIVLGLGLGLIALAAKIFIDAVVDLIDAMNRLVENSDKIEEALRNAGKGVTAFADEAVDGLTTLMDSMGAFDFLKLGGIVDLIEILSNVPDDMAGRMAGLVEGLENLQPALPIIEEINAFGKQVGFGDNRSIGGLFRALDEVREGTGDRLSAIVEGIEAFGTTTKTLGDIIHIGKGIEWGDNRSIGGLFRALDEVRDGTGDKLMGIVDGVAALGEVIEPLKSIANLPDEMDLGDNWGLGNFFKAFEHITPESGEALSSFAQGMFDLGAALTQMSGLNNFGGEQNIFERFLNIGGSASGLENFLDAFSGITTDVGEGVIAFSEGIKAFDEGVMNTLRSLSELGGDAGGNAHGLHNFFNVFSAVDENVGDKLSGLATGLLELKESTGVLDTLKEFADTLGGKDSGRIGDFLTSLSGADGDVGSKLSGLASGLTELKPALGVLTSLQEFAGTLGRKDSNRIGEFLSSLSDSVSSDLGTKLTDASAGIQEFADAIPILKGAIESVSSLDTGALGNAMNEIQQAFATGVSDDLSNVADAISDAVDAMLSAATERTSEFRTAGEDLAGGLEEGVRSRGDRLRAAGRGLGNNGAGGARESRQRFVNAGKFIGAGLAEGIRNATEEVETAARNLANAAAAASEGALEMASPSRRFMRIGEFVSQGFAIGITNDGGKVLSAVADTADAAIKVMQGKTFQLKDSTKGFYDGLVDQLNDNPMIRRLEELGKHSQAAYATAVKEKRIQDALDREQAEDEKERAERDVIEAEQSVYDAKKALRDAEQQELSEKRTAEDHARDIAAKRRSLDDAEKKHRRSIQARERYEYKMHGEEAGVSFVEGVADGIIDNSDKLPTVAEIYSAVLYEELDYVKEQADNFIGIFDGMVDVRNSFKNVRTEARNLGRALGRVGSLSSSRAIRRNNEIIMDSVISISKEFIGLMDVLNKFEPYLPMLLDQFNGHLPAIIAAVRPFAPALANTLGGGLAAAIPAIAGPVAGIIAAIAGIGILLYDMANEQKILGFLRRAFGAVIAWIRELPEKLPRLLRMLIRGFVNLIKELPKFIGDLAVALIEAFVEILLALPDILPDLLIALVEAFIEIITVLPTLLIENSGRIIEALIIGVQKLVVGLIFALPRMFFRIGEAIVKGVIGGVFAMGKSLFGAVGTLFTTVIGLGKTLLGINSPSRVFQEMGENVVEGLIVGVTKNVGGMRQTISTAIRKMLDDLGDMPDGRIRITPVLDAEAARKGIDDLLGRLSNASISADANIQNAAQVSTVRSEEQALREGVGQNITNIEYTQNNTSPRPLSAIEIYRNTRKQLELMR